MSSPFAQRSHEVEIMDDLNCSGSVVDQTLRELEIINRTLGGNGVTISGIKQLLKNTPGNRPVSIEDLGAGGGDMLKRIADWGSSKKHIFSLTGIDANPHITSFAQRNASGYKNIRFETLDIFSPEFKARKFDICIATLFTHHFSDTQLVELLTGLKNQALLGIVINDIHRHWLAFHSIRLLTTIFSRSKMVRNDAPLSVLRAFRRQELKTILLKAGITTYSLEWCWAFRWKLVIFADPIR